MKVKMERSNGLDSAYVASTNANGQKGVLGFKEQLIASGQVQQEQEWERLTAVVERLGDRLVQHPSVDAAHAYRDAVVELVQRAVHSGLTIHEAKTRGRQGKQKVFLQVEQINQQLIELMEQVLHQQQGSIDLLKIVGEIKGLLISLHL
ncbi:MAG: DUF327 family protein [Acidibacillus sp.]|nr:DUF327 family protein [Acidibacillus sp.]